MKINEEEGLATARIVNFYNDLFDSVNGSEKTSERDIENKLRPPVTQNSIHHAFWVNAKSELRRMNYVDRASRKIIKSIPTLTNWQLTIQNFEKLWNILNVEYGFSKLNTRFCNQGPLENLFGQIRSHAIRNNNPTPRQFKESFVTLFVNNMKPISVVHGNCEISNDDFMLFSLEEYLKDDVPNEIIEVHDNDCNDEPLELISAINVPENSMLLLLDQLHEIIIDVLKTVKNCYKCEESLKTSDFQTYCRQIICAINKLLKTQAHRKNILKIVLQYFKNWNVNLN